MGDDPTAGVHVDALTRVVVVSGEDDLTGEGGADGRPRGRSEVHAAVVRPRLAVQNAAPSIGAGDDPRNGALDRQVPHPLPGDGGESRRRQHPLALDPIEH